MPDERDSAASAHDGEAWAQAVTDAIARHHGEPGALLPILHAVQDRLGYLPPEALGPIAEAQNLSRAEVHGVVGFYHDFRTTAPGRRVVKLCRAEACQAMGADALAAHAEARLGVAGGETRADGEVTLAAVYCLGNCACAPAALVDGELHGRLSPARFDALVADVPRRPR
jgi:formate dehydrogenase subunit gamma